MAFNETKSPTYQFDLFYEVWHHKFTKRSDPLFLFFHYLLVQNEFKTVQAHSGNVRSPISNEFVTYGYFSHLCVSFQLSELILDGLLLSERHQEIAYLKNGEKYRLEAFESNEDLIVIFRVCLWLLLLVITFIR